MFRRKTSSLPEDIVFPGTLAELGYFVNDKDQIRQIKNPEQRYNPKTNRSERVNMMYRDAMNSCVADIVSKRLNHLGFETLRLPLGAGPTDNHVPIYLSPGVKHKKRVIVYFPERQIDPIIQSFRVTGENDIATGSVLKIVDGIMNGPAATTDKGAPGFIITNPSQLFWYRGEQRPVTWYRWLNLPMPTAVSPAYRVDPEKNLIPGNANSKEHVEYIFEEVLAGSTVDADAKLDIIAMDWLGKEVLSILLRIVSPLRIKSTAKADVSGPNWSQRVSSICFCSPQHRIVDLLEHEAPTDLIEFLSKKCRAYFVSNEKQGTVVEGRPEFGCNCYASGDQTYKHQVLIRAWPAILDHFNAVHTLEDFEEVERFAPLELEGNGTQNGQENGYEDHSEA
ncbi:uncharacterized protein AB675_11827 [Cyphellophora attinorum]|uniref:Arb2 domain-containing protein n=1 Tax=Cyphellophora attinorum TaxID=1664694 RepID=A0A0N1NYB7_9EURO|nr:uncharacterized protein AB675_11827 [Phialophora attinorum]KPI36886.1 hypothetical protein AB675_11827 [Phialophora attinorum]